MVDSNSLLQQLASSGPLIWSASGSFALAAAGQVAWLMRDLQLALRTDAFADQIRKLIAAKNLERAVKLTYVSESPVCRLARAALEASLAGRSAADTVRDVMPEQLAVARRGLAALSVVSAIALLLCFEALGQSFTHGGSDPLLPVLAAEPALLLVLTVRNLRRWNGWRDELTVVARAVVDA